MVHEVDEELREIKREIIESRGLVIKTNNLTNALSADIKSIAKRQQSYERRLTWNSATAYVVFVVVVFAAQVLGIDLSLTQQFLIVILALVSSIGVAGIPAASLVAIIIIMQNAGFSEDAIKASLGLILTIDRPLDMARTTVNVFGDTVGAVVIAKSEGETLNS